MNVAGTVLLFCSVYLIGVWIGRIQAGGSRKALRKNMQWKNRYREHLTEMRLRSTADAFHGLSSAFRESGSRSFDRANREIAATALAETEKEICQPCGGCHLGKMQLQKDTYYLRYLMTAFGKNGRINTDDMPRIFNETCCEMPKYLDELNEELERSQVQIDWKKRFLESREVAALQFQEAENMLLAIASSGEEWEDVTEEWDAAVRRECRKLRLRLGRILVESDHRGHLQIHMILQTGSRRPVPSREIADAVGLALKRRFRVEENGKSMIGREAARVVLMEEPVYGVCLGVARASEAAEIFPAIIIRRWSFRKDVICCAFRTVWEAARRPRGERGCRGADGTTDGVRFSLEGTVKSINSVLLLREGEQCPATLDLHCLNLYTGDLSSRKQGAAETFIKRGEKVTVLESADMPIGWNRNVTGEESVSQLEKETFVVLVTDGVVEALPGTDKEEFLAEILRRVKGGNPQMMAEDILALAVGQEEPRDDMTVLVAAIQSRN